MAVKFSDFQAKQDASVDVTEVVGYLTSGELNVRIPPANLDTTYAVSTGNAGASPTISLQGTKPGQAAAINPSTVSLTGSGATLLSGNGSTTIDFASTAYAITSTDTSPAGTVPLVLTGTGGGDAGTDTVNLVGAGGIGITSSSNTVTITGAGGGGVTSFTNTNGTFVSAATANSAATGPVTTGVIDLSATGTPSASNFLRGDNTWATPPSGSGTVTSVGSGDSNTILIGGTAADPTVAAITAAGVGTGLLNLATGGQIQTAINSAIAGGVTFKGGFNANSGAIDGGSNNLTTGGARVEISVGDLYVVTTAGNFYGDATVPLAIGDQVLCKTAAAAGASVIGDWNTIESNVVPATAGVTDASTVKGVAGFDNQMFAATANGFITSTTLNTVIITRVGAGNGFFYVDGIQQSGITLMPDVTYLIDQSDSSNDGHPLILSTTTPSQTEYSTGVIYLLDNVVTTYANYVNTTNFNAATTRQVRISLNQVAPTLYYVCSIHQGMGGDISRGGDYVSWNLTGDSGTTEVIANGNTVDVAGGTDITTVASSADTLTVNHAAITRTDTTSTDAPAAGASVALVKTISTSAQGHVTAIDVSTVTWPAAGGGFGSINQTTGTGSSLGAITLGSTPAAAFNCLISISGVTQNYLDAAGTPNWTVSTNTLTFAFNPPVTATNGIQIIVIA